MMIMMNSCENTHVYFNFIVIPLFFSCKEDAVDNLSDDGDIAADLPSEDG